MFLIKFSVIFIDFNYEGKPGEKSLRSLDQVTYQDGVNRGRSNLKDSYGNPVQYDTLEQIDANKPSKDLTDPNKFIIPGYASGILQPHELPTRSNPSVESSRAIDDDRIHFIDPLQNSFQNSDKPFQAPSPSLSTPLGSNDNGQTLSPINIPRPNIDLNESPQAPIDDPLNHVLTPPIDNSFATPQGPSQPQPSFELEAPQSKTPQFAIPQDLTPPQIQGDGQSGVFIPRPNIDVSETPIDNTNGPLNQGLLPPSDAPNTNFVSNVPSFINPSQEGPIVFTDVLFAPKPSNGLLPPKDPSPNDVNFQEPTTTAFPTTVNKFSFGGSSGVLGNSGTVAGRIPEKVENTVNKFTGSFGGSSGILGGSPASNQIPVVVVQAPAPSISNVLESPTTPNVFQPLPDAVNKYQGGFGGPAGVLVNDQFVASSANKVKPAAPTTSTNLNNKFDGSFGGVAGVLGENKVVEPSVQTPATLVQLPNINNNLPLASKDRGSQKYNGGFGGSAGVLQPYDNSKN